MKEHGNFSTKTEYEAIPDVPDNPSSELSAGPTFYTENTQEVSYTDSLDSDGNPDGTKLRHVTKHNRGDRIDNRTRNPEQAIAEAYAAKPYVDIATEMYEQYKKEDPGGYEENWKDVDGLEALIALGRDASTEAGKKWQLQTPEERNKADLHAINPENKPLLEYMHSSVEKGKNLEEIGDELEAETTNPDSAIMQGILEDLYKQQSQAKTAAERDAARKDISLMEEFANRLEPDGDSDTGIHSSPADAYMQFRLARKNSPNDEQQAALFKQSLAGMNETKRRNRRDARGYELVKAYAKSRDIDEKTLSREAEIQRQRDIVNNLFVGSRKQPTEVTKTPTEKPEAKAANGTEVSIVPDDPRERMKFAREFFVAENMTPENIPVLKDYLKKLLKSNANQVVEARQKHNDSRVTYPARLQTLIGRTLDHEYEDKVGAGTFLYDSVKDKIKLKSGKPIEYVDFGLLEIDNVFDKLGLDVREILPDYDDKFSS